MENEVISKELASQILILNDLVKGICEQMLQIASRLVIAEKRLSEFDQKQYFNG